MALRGSFQVDAGVDPEDRQEAETVLEAQEEVADPPRRLKSETLTSTFTLLVKKSSKRNRSVVRFSG